MLNKEQLFELHAVTCTARLVRMCVARRLRVCTMTQNFNHPVEKESRRKWEE